MEILLPLLIVAALIGIVIGLIRISLSDEVARMYNKVNESFSNIDVALTTRYDAITQLANVCKAYSSAELNALVNSLYMRSGGTIGQMQQTAAQLDKAFAMLHATVEAYPELKSAALYDQLMARITASEVELSAARRLYNSNASEFNSLRMEFFYAPFASKYAAFPLFQAEARKRDVPVLNL